MSAPFRVVFAGTPEFAVPSLVALLADPRFVVVGIFTQPDRPVGRGLSLTSPPVAAVARAANLPVFQPARLDAAAIRILCELAPDFLVVAAYGLILSPEILAIARIAPVNIHASILPRWRGASPIQAVILAGDTETGISFMKMEPGLDTGPTYAISTFSLDGTERVDELTDQLARLGGKRLPDVLIAIASGTLSPTPQNKAFATICRKVKKSDGEIDFRRDTAEVIQKKWRAYQPWPGIVMMFLGKRIKLIEIANRKSQIANAKIGELVCDGECVSCVATDGVAIE